MAGGGKIRVVSWDDTGTPTSQALVTDHALHVRVVNPSGGSGGDVNIAEVGGVAIGTTVPVSGPIEVEQATHDNLNANANIQVGNADVSALNPVPVSDGGGSITVDGTVTISVTVTENAAAVADPTLIPIGATRDDALSSLTEVEDDWVRLRVDAFGALWVRNRQVAQQLSGSTSGRPIKVVATASPGTTIHVTPAATTQKVFINATNTSGTGVLLTLQWGGTTSPDDLRRYLIPPNSSICVSNGDVIANGLLIRAFAGTANVINLTGYVETQ